MRSDLHDQLSKAGPSPSRPLDVARVWRRGRELRRRRYALFTVGLAAALIVVVGGSLGLTRLDGNEVRPPVTATESPDDSAQRLARVRAELYSQLRELRAVMRSVTAQRDELLSDLESLRDAGDPQKARALERQVDALDKRIADLAGEIDQIRERIAAVTARIIADRRFEEPTPEATEGQSREYVGFRPRSSVEDGDVVMPLTFIDGSVATIVADRHLGLQDMSASIYTAGGLDGVDRTMDFRYRDGSAFMHEGPLETYEGADGSDVELWHPVPDMPAGCPNLVYRFGEWFVGVRTCQDELSRSEKKTWASSLSGHVTDDGFLVLSAEAPLVLQKAGGHEGPELILGMERANWVQFEPGKCDPYKIPDEGDIRVMSDGTRVSFSQIGGGENSFDHDWLVTWCEDGLMTVQVDNAYRRFAETAAKGLRLRDIGLTD